MIKEVGFTLKPVWKGQEAQRAIDRQKTSIGQAANEVDKYGRRTEAATRRSVSSWQRVRMAATSATSSIKTGANSTYSAIVRMNSALDKTGSKLLTMKNAFAASAVGAAAIWGVKSVFELGEGNRRTAAKLRREFGENGATRIEGQASRIAQRAGMQDDDAAQALIPLSRALEAYQEGASFRGIKGHGKGGTLTAADADRFKSAGLKFGADTLATLSVLHPDMDKNELGQVMADAMTGPEGMKRFFSAMGYGTRSKALIKAQEKGEAFKALTPEEQKRFGITKKGQYLEQGDLVRLIMERAGDSDKAADSARHKFGFQMTAIKSKFEDVLGNVGQTAMERLNAEFGKGTTIAERFAKWIDSPNIKNGLKSIADGIAFAVEKLIKLTSKLPEIASWVKEHKWLLGGAAATYAGFRFLGTGPGKWLAGKVGLGGVAQASENSDAMKVFVTNMPGGGFGGGGDALGGVAGSLAKMAGGGGIAAFLASPAGLAVATVAAGAIAYKLGVPKATRDYIEASDDERAQMKAQYEADKKLAAEMPRLSGGRILPDINGVKMPAGLPELYDVPASLSRDNMPAGLAQWQAPITINLSTPMVAHPAHIEAAADALLPPLRERIVRDMTNATLGSGR